MKINDFYRIIIHPSETLQRNNEYPQWFMILLIVSVAEMFVTYFSFPFSNYASNLEMSSTLGPETAKRTLALAMNFQYIGLLFIPFIKLFKWLIYSGIIYSILEFAGSKKVMFKNILMMVGFAEVVLVLMSAINLFVLSLKGYSSINSSMDLNAIVGLDFLLSNKYFTKTLYALLSNFNVFTVWHVVVLTIGLSVVSQLEKWKSAIIVSLVWLLGVGFQVAIVALSTQMQKNMGL